MLSIHQVINKLQVLNQTPNPSEIDFDLMLDYTRHLYDLLLEQKANTLHHTDLNYVVPPTLQTSELEQNIIEAKPIGNMLQNIVDNITVHTNTTADTNALNDEIESIFSVTESGQEPDLEKKEENTENNTVTDADEFIAEMENIVNSFEVTTIEKDEELDNPIPRDFGGISLEIPAFDYISTPIPKTIIQEEDPLTTKEPLNRVNDNLEQQEEKPLSSAQGFVAPSFSNYKDFRTHLSFNDHYLFLNELFHNRKELMDSTISRINASTASGSAKTWQLIEEIAEDLTWDADDATVQSFYALLDKHFTTK